MEPWEMPRVEREAEGSERVGTWLEEGSVSSSLGSRERVWDEAGMPSCDSMRDRSVASVAIESGMLTRSNPSLLRIRTIILLSLLFSSLLFSFWFFLIDRSMDGALCLSVL